MQPSLTSLQELEAFIADDPAESVALEYKSSKILAKGEHQSICKAVSAFANSAGGRFIIGIDSSIGSLRLDGGWQQSSKLDWLYRAINSGTFPAVETAYVTEIAAETGRYYVIDVAVSPMAPHQSQDHRYYKRRGSHSDPMEHYEIEDVRNRPKSKTPPLQISLHFQRTLLSIKFRNVSQNQTIDNILVDIETNFPFDEGLLGRLRNRSFKQMGPGTEHVFLAGNVSSFLQANGDAELRISASYQQGGVKERARAEFYLADYMYTSLLTPPIVEALDKISQKIGDATGAIGKLVRKAEVLGDIADGTGLRLSHRTLRGLLGEKQLFDPGEFAWQAYKIILDITDDEAIQLANVFSGYEGVGRVRGEYEKIPQELKVKFERYFRPPTADA